MVLHDWQRGKIPFFVPPPQQSDGGASESAEQPIGITKEDGVSSDRTAAAMKAIAGIISSQQNMNVPCHKENNADNEDTENADNEDIESSDNEDNDDIEPAERSEWSLGTDVDY